MKMICTKLTMQKALSETQTARWL